MWFEGNKTNWQSLDDVETHLIDNGYQIIKRSAIYILAWDSTLEYPVFYQHMIDGQDEEIEEDDE